MVRAHGNNRRNIKHLGSCRNEDGGEAPLRKTQVEME